VAINLEQARAAALRLTGLTATPTITPAPASVDRTPFLGQRIGSLGPVWQIAWQDLRLSLPSAPSGVSDQYARTVVLRLAQSTGQFLGATLRAAGELPSTVRPTPDGEVAQQQLQQLTERYEGLPRTPPGRSLLQALDAVLTKGVGNPLRAREIHVLYVMHTYQGRSPIPAWVITLNGIPKIPHKGPEGARVPAWQLNHIRNVVDANTGLPLFATTIPQPGPSTPLVA
jgi:hypothetical protein